MSLHLSDLYLITPEPPINGEYSDFLNRLSISLASGVKLVQLRTKTLGQTAYRELVDEVFIRCQENDARLILNGPIVNLASINADGIHLSTARLMTSTQRPCEISQLLSAACHNLDELQQAQRIGVDLVTLSPVLETATHPDALPLGWARFGQLARSVRIPVYALGGMSRNDLIMAKSHAAHGIAAISSLW
jgi:thiamine-phosphate pyrophosphorylase